MKPVLFKGSGVALVTPMRQDGSVNFSLLEKLVQYQIMHHTDAIIVCGTTGEAPTLDDEEHLAAIACAVQAAEKRVPVIAGTGSNNTQHAIELSREAGKIGADGFLLVTPYYNKTNQRGLVEHFFTIADQVERPCIVYNVPSRTGVNIQPETYLALSKHPLIVGAKEANGNFSAIAQTIALCGEELPLYSGNDDQIVPLLSLHPLIVGAKEANGNFSAIAQTIALCGEELPLYSGNDDQIVPLLSLGGIGVISVLANLVPDAVHEICAAYFNGDCESSAQLQKQYLELAQALFCDINPIPVKTALSLMGIDVGRCRLPLPSPAKTDVTRIRNSLLRAGLPVMQRR